ncbi:hypothetical protein [Alphacoronavirus Mink/China/1/2016]|nr:hypothetical protein [Alphacoronavirus Mink/China/1/2016]
MRFNLITLIPGSVWFKLPRPFKDWVVSKVKRKVHTCRSTKIDYRRRAIYNLKIKNASTNSCNSFSSSSCFRNK